MRTCVVYQYKIVVVVVTRVWHRRRRLNEIAESANVYDIDTKYDT